jgi:hypothetical protein
MISPTRGYGYQKHAAARIRWDSLAKAGRAYAGAAWRAKHRPSRRFPRPPVSFTFTACLHLRQRGRARFHAGRDAGHCGRRRVALAAGVVFVVRAGPLRAAKGANRGTPVARGGESARNLNVICSIRSSPAGATVLDAKDGNVLGVTPLEKTYPQGPRAHSTSPALGWLQGQGGFGSVSTEIHPPRWI